MKEFSALYKKMCGTAKEVQDVWPKYSEDWNSYCRKGDYRDGITEELHTEGITEEEKRAIFSENAWIPQSHELRERFFRCFGLDSIAKQVNKRYSEYLDKVRPEELLKHPFDHFELMDVITLMFIMEDYFNKVWNFEKDEWEVIRR
jgi:hypothetical protein